MLDEFTSERDDNEPRRHRRKESKSSVVAMALVVILLGGIGVGGWWAYENYVKDFLGGEDYEGDGNGEEVQFEVKEGELVSDIAFNLEEAGIVASSKAFVKAAEDSGSEARGIQVGVYPMEMEMSAQSALDVLVDPDNIVTDGVTIKEGERTFQIYAKLSEKYGVPVEDFEAAAEDPEALGVAGYWFEDFDENTVVSLEGFLFPATYDFSEDMSADAMLKAMVAKFNAEVDRIGFVDQVQNELGIEPWKALQIASVVQYESGRAEDDAKIARVFYNRIYDENAIPEIGGKRMQTDASLSYGSELAGEGQVTSGDLTKEQLYDESNEWSTHANEGYMPSAISNPGAAALEAAAKPADGDWLYFVTTADTGEALFAETNAEHEENIAKSGHD
ncbi:endolytic transglycosylase MltG [Salininema proteolyticum]|uniref:Endolytic murein transglycosylase n=1 Tax=Salininema proteolyticum TaxID=1607685 RepID=A0ABV8TZJ8_9ACTN